MTRFIIRTALTSAALVLLFAGSFNLSRTRAGSAEEVGTGTEVVEAPAPSKCQDLAGCPGGPITCGTIQLPDGTTIRCGKD